MSQEPLHPKKQIELLQQELDQTRTNLCIRIAEMDESYKREIDRLYRDHLTRKEALEDEAYSRIRDITSRLSKTKQQLNKEESSCSGIHILPPELLTKIFEWLLDERVPPRSLALVSKLWKNVLLASPSLWRTLEVEIVPADNLQHHYNTLKRRIELSGASSNPLNVILRASSLLFIKSGSIEQFRLVAGTGIERWKSLTLEHDLLDSEFSLERIFHGTFSSLQTVNFSYFGPLNPFGMVEELLAPCMSSVREITIHGRTPDFLRSCTPDSLAKVTRLAGHTEALEDLPRPPALFELETWSRYGGECPQIDCTRFPRPPKRTIFRLITQSDLAMLDCKEVQELDIDMIAGGYQSGVYVDFPSLTKLRIFDITLAAGITAENLQSLECICPDIDEIVDRDRSVHPISVTLLSCANPQAVRMVLGRWEQLEEVTLLCLPTCWSQKWADEFRSICPALRTIRIKLKDEREDEGSGVNACIFASQLFVNRRELPLETVEFHWNNTEIQRWHKSSFTVHAY